MVNNNNCVVKFVQINLHRCKAATQQLVLNMEANDVAVAFVQEPYCFRGFLPGFPSTYRIYQDFKSEVIKAAIIVRATFLTAFLDLRFLDYNMVTIDIILNNKKYFLFSYYFEPSRSIEPDLQKINEVFQTKSLSKLIWGMDSNSKSELWFSPLSDGRGNILADFISSFNLYVINEDCGPTFCSKQGSSYIDVTVMGADLLSNVTRWGLSDCDSLSDHAMIEFDLSFSDVTSNVPGRVLFNTKRANWKKFEEICSQNVPLILSHLDKCNSKDSLNGIVDFITSVIFHASTKSMPIKRAGMCNVPWWSLEISYMRKRLNAARRRFQRTSANDIRELYKRKYLDLRKKYNHMLVDAKNESWKKFLSGINNLDVWKKLYTYGVKENFMKRIEITGLQLQSGNCTSSLEETIDVILDKAFPPDCDRFDNAFHVQWRLSARSEYSSHVDPPFSPAEVDEIIRQLKHGKAPGPDAIPNEIIKYFHRFFPTVLHRLFNNCLKLGAFPRAWKKALVIVIPKKKTLKVPHVNNLRCICLLSSLGKCFEKLVTNRINWHLYSESLLSADQYGFTPQRSSEDALLRLSNLVSRGKMKGLYTILIFLDIEGAFDNAWWPAILNLLKKMKLAHNVFNVVLDLLRDRSAELFLGATSRTRQPQKGCPQGSVSGPRFWNVIINDLLQSLTDLFCCDVIAFADDLLLCIQGKELQHIFSLAQDILNFISEWSINFKLKFNHAKSKTLLIDRRNTDYDGFQLVFNDDPLEMVKEIKYLGVFLDSKFNWKKHISYVSNKCEKLLCGLNRVEHNTFGVKSNVNALIYEQNIVPFITFSCTDRGTSMKKKINSKILHHVQRQILL